MNFLAHFHLAWPEEGLIVGALEGDYLKGPLKGNLPRGIERGVALHRAIDAFTDQHPQVVELREALPRPLRRYAGILIDLGFDHCLARRWHDFSDVPARQFNAAVYATLSAQDTHLSPAARAMSQRLREHDLLHLYREWHTVTASAERIGERFSRGNPFADLDRELTPFKEDIERAFQAFYPELQQFATERISTLRD